MTDRDLIRVGDTLHLGKADWVLGDRSMTVRVSDIRYGLDDADSPVVGILATITLAGRGGAGRADGRDRRIQVSADPPRCDATPAAAQRRRLPRH